MTYGLRFLKSLSIVFAAVGISACSSSIKVVEPTTPEKNAGITTTIRGSDNGINYECEQSVNQSLDWISCKFRIDSSINSIYSCWKINYFNPYSNKVYESNFRNCFELSYSGPKSAEKFLAIRNKALVDLKSMCGDSLETCLLAPSAIFSQGHD